MQYVGGVVERHVHVVRNHYDRDAVVFVEVFNKPVHFFGGVGVKACDRLVEQKHFLRGAKGAGKKDALLLAARKVSVASFCESKYSKPLHIFERRLPFRLVVKWPQARRRLAAGDYDFVNAGRKVALHLSLLGKVSDLIFLKAAVKNYLAVERFLQSKNRPHERRLSASVFADNAKVVASVDAKVKVLDEDIFIVAKRKALAFQQRHERNYAPNLSHCQ